MDFNELIDLVMGSEGHKGEEYPDNDQVGVSVVLGSLLKKLISGNLLADNDLKALKAYIEEHSDEMDGIGTVTYDYGTTLNIYTDDPKSDTTYMKVNPFTDAMSSVVPDLGEYKDTILNMASSFGSGWDEMSADQRLLDQQYDLIGSSRWPQTANEIVIVVDEYNDLPDFALFILGLRSQEDITGALAGTGAFYEPFEIEDLIGKTYKVVSDGDYYIKKNAETGEWEGASEAISRSTLDKETVDAMDPLELKVVGVVRPKKGVAVTSINGYVGYTRALTELMLQRAAETDAAKAQLEAALSVAKADEDGSPATVLTEENFVPYVSAVSVSGLDYGGKSDSVDKDKDGEVDVGDVVDSFKLHTELMRKLGVSDVDDPVAVKIRCHSFESKAQIEAFLARYSEETGNPLKYTDQLAIMMSFVEQMSSTVTQVLVGFAAISLIVSTIMIAIIIYTSVLERRKEIGVLRSLGARKKDISRVFLAESAILGAYSGAIGVILAVIFSLAGSAILAAVMGISGLMQVQLWQCVAMFFISILLSMLAGFIPSRIASKKDPTVALRSE